MSRLMAEGHATLRQPSLLPLVDLPIHVDRDRETLDLSDTQICVAPPVDGDERARQVRWCVDGSLLPDEMILVFGRPLDWVGRTLRKDRTLKLVENVFPQPFTLTRHAPHQLSGIPRIAFPPGIDTVGWAYAAVLVRGDDTPWIRSALLRLVRDCP